MAMLIDGKVPVAIQAVPQRKAWVEGMIEQLGTGAPYYDTEFFGPLWSMERILKDFTQTGVLVLQDDVVLPPWFAEEFGKAWLGKEHGMTLFAGMSRRKKMLPLYERGDSYQRVTDIWGPANYYPASLIQGYFEWTKGVEAPKRGEPEVGGRRFRQDDNSMGLFLRQTKRAMWLTLPNLVNHRNTKSTLGNPRSVGGYQWVSGLFGKDLLRQWKKDLILSTERKL